MIRRDAAALITRPAQPWGVINACFNDPRPSLLWSEGPGVRSERKERAGKGRGALPAAVINSSNHLPLPHTAQGWDDFRTRFRDLELRAPGLVLGLDLAAFLREKALEKSLLPGLPAPSPVWQQGLDFQSPFLAHPASWEWILVMTRQK